MRDKQRGRPVLVEFWDFCRSNSLRALPYVRAWHERYAAAGLRLVVEELLKATIDAAVSTKAIRSSDFERVIVPGTTHWNHPGFFAYFAVSSSAPGIVAELLAAALNVNGMLWKTSPSATELEQLSLDWLRQMLGLPDGPGDRVTGPQEPAAAGRASGARRA